MDWIHFLLVQSGPVCLGFLTIFSSVLSVYPDTGGGGGAGTVGSGGFSQKSVGLSVFFFFLTPAPLSSQCSR